MAGGKTIYRKTWILDKDDSSDYRSSSKSEDSDNDDLISDPNYKVYEVSDGELGSSEESSPKEKKRKVKKERKTVQLKEEEEEEKNNNADEEDEADDEDVVSITSEFEMLESPSRPTVPATSTSASVNKKVVKLQVSKKQMVKDSGKSSRSEVDKRQPRPEGSALRLNRESDVEGPPEHKTYSNR